MGISTLQRIFSAFTTGIVSGTLATLPIGPSGIESIKRHLHHGILGGILVGIGSNLADIFYLFLSLLGLKQFTNRPKGFDATLWLICGFVLIGIGIKNMLHKNHLNHITTKNHEPTPILKCFLTGFLLTLLNPATPVIWIGISSSILSIWQQQGLYLYLVLVGTICGILINFPLQHLLIHRGIHDFRIKPNLLLNSLLGFILIVLGCIFSVKGLRIFI